MLHQKHFTARETHKHLHIQEPQLMWAVSTPSRYSTKVCFAVLFFLLFMGCVTNQSAADQVLNPDAQSVKLRFNTVCSSCKSCVRRDFVPQLATAAARVAKCPLRAREYLAVAPRGPSHLEGVVLDVAQQRPGERELLGANAVPVDGEACEVLQGGEGLGLVHRPSQLQHHRALLYCLWTGFLGGLLLPLLLLLDSPPGAHVVLHQAGHVGEGRKAGSGGGAGVQ